MKLVSSVLACAWLALAACESRLDLGRNAAPDASTADDNDDDTSSDAATSPPATTTPDASDLASECDRVCTRVIACGLVAESKRAQCLVGCNGGSTPAERTCILQTSCAVMTDACGLPTGDTDEPDDTFEIQVCQDACDNAKFQDCIDASAHAHCRDLCGTAAAAPRDAFASCVHTTGECSAIADCYAVFAN